MAAKKVGLKAIQLLEMKVDKLVDLMVVLLTEKLEAQLVETKVDSLVEKKVLN